eukprot:TRINITY_DN2150_c0_g3_i2.p1 TRINITY_DN2150_c0_g3~~TRINITY_DN2150_c0_g3_i2.p1  ORF type:complete len:370 (+),score=85.21 TRINITY_DN2150_c0_g3_i2:66-1175(+)
MCIRDRYQRRVHGEVYFICEMVEPNQEDLDKKVGEEGEEQQEYNAAEIPDMVADLDADGTPCLKYDDQVIYRLYETIGNGAFAKVKRAGRRYGDGENEYPFAIKKLSQKALKKQICPGLDGGLSNNLEKVQREIEIWRRLDHPNIVMLHEIIECEEYYYLSMDYCKGGSVMKIEEDGACERNKELESIFLANKGKEIMTKQLLEELTRFVFGEVCKGIDFLHNQKNITHRDIKIDNILVNFKPEAIIQVRLCDFTNALKLEPDTLISSPDCNVYFGAPEFYRPLEKGFSPFKSDIWALGVCIYLFTHGKFPFFEKSEISTELAILEKEVEYDGELSEGLISLLKRLLTKDPSIRPSISEVLKDPWFAVV